MNAKPLQKRLSKTPVIERLKRAIAVLCDRTNRYWRLPNRHNVAALGRASASVGDVLGEIVSSSGAHLSRTLLKRAISSLVSAKKILERRRPYISRREFQWFAGVRRAIQQRYERFQVLLGEGRAVYTSRTDRPILQGS